LTRGIFYSYMSVFRITNPNYLWNSEKLKPPLYKCNFNPYPTPLTCAYDRLLWLCWAFFQRINDDESLRLYSHITRKSRHYSNVIIRICIYLRTSIYIYNIRMGENFLKSYVISQRRHFINTCDGMDFVFETQRVNVFHSRTSSEESIFVYNESDHRNRRLAGDARERLNEYMAYFGTNELALYNLPTIILSTVSTAHEFLKIIAPITTGVHSLSRLDFHLFDQTYNCERTRLLRRA